jgi:hypothetical protein
MTDKQRSVSPEWLVTRREDALLDERYGQGWGVSSAPLVRGASFTDFGLAEMAVPDGDSEAAKSIRLHELIHAAISPAEVPAELLSLLGVSSQAVRIAEEVRVNLVGRRVESITEYDGDIWTLTDGTEKALCDSICEKKSWNDALNIYLTTYNTKVHKAVKRRLRRVTEWRDHFLAIDAYLRSFGLDYDKGEHSYAHAKSASITDPRLYVWKDSKGVEHNTIFPFGFQNYTLSLANTIDEWFIRPPKMSRRGKQEYAKKKREVEVQSSKWEPFVLGTTSLTESTSSFLSKRKRPAMTGKHPSRPDRLLTDPERRIFRETVKSAGGVVVFDCSGSMGVSHTVVADAVKQFAGATVLVYSHTSGRASNAWIVARNGRMISESEFEKLPLNSGNGVDGPALRWAIRQRRSQKDFILWVSDGQVTGKFDAMAEELLAECAVLSLKHNIVGVDSCEDAIKLLAEMKRMGSMPRNRYCRVITNWIARHTKGFDTSAE